ncbi:MAG: hypothetical protein JNM89_10040 [Hyphomicrobiaceae bacterium]|nr:hypothetical protein [Hyphomicrobiaceae bacterium]
MDTTRITRLPNSKELFAFPQSTAYTTPLTVPEALTALSTLLVSANWQPYEQAFASQSTGQDLAIVYFKNDRQLLSVMISKAPAQNDATSISYTGLMTGHDLPFPKSASAIKYDPTRPYLGCVSTSDPESLSRELREGLVARGWQAWSPRDAKRVDIADQKTEQGITAFYVHASAPSLRLSLVKRNEGQTAVTVEGISAEVLAALGKSVSNSDASSKDAESKDAVSKDTERTAKQEPTAAPSAQEPVDPTKNLADDIMREARAAIGEALRGIKEPSAKTGKSKGDVEQADAGAPLAAMQPGEAGSNLPVPLPEGSENINIDDGQLEFSNTASVSQVAAFYRSALKAAGWKVRATPINKPNMVVVEFARSGKDSRWTIMRMGDQTRVTATGSVFETAAKEAGDREDKAGSSSTRAEPSITAEQLEADEAAGLPVPKQSTSKGSEKTMFRVSALADVPAPLEAVLGFYRREIAKRPDWQMLNEETNTKATARIRYATPAGPALLTLTEKSGTTSVVLLVRKQKEAQASGLMPAAGQVRILIGNVTDKDVQVSLAKKTIKVGAGKGAKAPDGPTLEVKPGTYVVKVKGAGISDAPPEEISVGADEIWGLMIGPGGVLPLPMY